MKGAWCFSRGYVIGRSSWGRRGLVIATAVEVHPGFVGCLTLEITGRMKGARRFSSGHDHASGRLRGCDKERVLADLLQLWFGEIWGIRVENAGHMLEVGIAVQ